MEVHHMINLTAMRVKYAPQQYRRHGIVLERHKPGGRDVLELCDAVDQLRTLVMSCQYRLPVDDQNESEEALRRILGC